MQVGMTILGNEPVGTIERVKASGCDFIRARVFWTDPRAGWAWVEETCVRAENAGLRVMLSFWVQAGERQGDTTTGMDIQSYADFCLALACRFRGRIFAYCLDNEPDMGRVDPAAYADRVRAGTTAIKSVDPAALVIAGELAADGGADKAWTRAWLTAQQLTGVWPDVVSFHAYDDYRADWTPPGVVGKATWLRKQLAELTASPPTVWLTECGGASAPSDKYTERSEANQAEIIKRFLGEAYVANLPVVSIYRAADQTDQHEPLKFGIMPSAAAAMPKAAWSAFVITLATLRARWPIIWNPAPTRIGKRG